MPQTLTRRAQLAPDRRADRRCRIERLLHLAGHLPDGDRLLIEQVYGGGLSMADAARLAGKPARALSRRIGRIVERMEHPLFSFLAGHADLLEPPVRRTASLVIFERQSLRRAARSSGASLHQVRQHMRSVRTLARM